MTLTQHSDKLTRAFLVAPLVIALGLTGCTKEEKKAEATPAVASPPAAINSATTTAPSNTATATASSVPATNTANMTAEQHQDAREDIMKSWGKASKAMGAMVKDPTTFKADEFKAQAAKLDQDPWVHFPETAKGGEAKDEIWTNATDYQQHIDKYKAAVTALNTAAQSATSVDGVKAQFGEVGASCKSCHEKYKKD